MQAAGSSKKQGIVFLHSRISSRIIRSISCARWTVQIHHTLPLQSTSAPKYENPFASLRKSATYQCSLKSKYAARRKTWEFARKFLRLKFTMWLPGKRRETKGNT